MQMSMLSLQKRRKRQPQSNRGPEARIASDPKRHDVRACKEISAGRSEHLKFGHRVKWPETAAGSGNTSGRDRNAPPHNVNLDVYTHTVRIRIYFRAQTLGTGKPEILGRWRVFGALRGSVETRPPRYD